MGSQSDQPPLVAIVGETGSGKTALALELAERFDGEIIAADSRTIYKGMDIGTAKPLPADRQRVPHYLLDIATPDEAYTAADYKAAAQQVIHEVAAKGKIPFLVGGSGLYIDAVLYDFTFAPKSEPAERVRLQKMDVYELQAELEARGIPRPTNVKNPRHLIRRLETGGLPAADRHLRGNTLIIGLQPDREELKAIIAKRTEAMIKQGLEAEVRQLVDRYGWSCAVLQTIGYQEFRPYLEGQESLEEVRQTIIKNTIQYAKRQRTWFRRNKSIHWVSEKERAVDLMTSFLNK